MKNKVETQNLMEIEVSDTMKISIINEALLGVRCLSEILKEYSITEREFFIWKDRYLKKCLAN